MAEYAGLIKMAITALGGFVCLVLGWKIKNSIKDSGRREERERKAKEEKKQIEDFINRRNDGHDINEHFSVRDGRKWTPRTPSDT
jgi:hypothetical protein